MVSERFGKSWEPLKSLLDTLAQLGSNGTIELSQSHGDFQAGNIMVSHKNADVTLIDWEHSAERTHLYDRMVNGLKSRASKGLAERVRNALQRDLPGVRVNGQAMALFLLEDLAWFLRESLTGPFTMASEGLVQYRREVESLGNLKSLLSGSS
jgi:hypothetical protein